MEIIKAGQVFEIDPNWVEIASTWANGPAMSEQDMEEIADAIASGSRVVRVDFWHDSSCQNERAWYST